MKMGGCVAGNCNTFPHLQSIHEFLKDSLQMPMAYTEEALLLLLDLRSLEGPSIYKGIAEVLGLDFFEDLDRSLYTISSDMFVLDITSEGFTLLFVDETLNSRLKHIQTYLNAYLSNPRTLYYLIRFFTRFTVQAPRQLNLAEQPGIAHLSKYKNICECVFSEVFCIQKQLDEIEMGYNIFTHRIEYTHAVPLLSLTFGVSGEEYVEFKEGVRILKNLFWYFHPEEFNMKSADFLPPGEYYYDDGRIKAVEGNIYVEGTRCALASFMYKAGLSLRDSVEYAKELRTRKIKRDEAV